ncbi:MAG: PD40 domain-containing protein, partial [Planctomycetaceae bacterium]|nr:PD40 domain-containing protein [Planctomycetaceae bacterium]
SEATNLVTGQTDANGGLDVFLWDRNLGTSKLISHASGSETTASDGLADELVSIDQTGAKVVFSSSGTNISSGQNDSNGGSDVFVNSTSVNGNTLVSRSSSSSTTTADGASQGGRISGDGKWIVYASLGTNIVSGVTDSNGGLDVFLFEFQTVTNRLVSRNQLLSNHTANDDSTTQLAIDATGSKIAYVSKATDLVSGQVDAGNSLDVFFYDRNLGGSGLVSSSSSNASTTASGASSNPTISDDGRFIVYESLGSNIVSSQSGTPGVKNIFRFDTVPAKNTLLSFATSGTKVGGNGNSVLPMISGSGNQTLWTSVASNQIANDSNGFADAFFDGSPALDMIGVKRGADFYEDLDGNQIYNSSDVKFTFGNSTDIPVVGDWDGDGYDNIGVFRNGLFYLDLNGNRIWDSVGGGDLIVSFGITNDVPVIGDWNGDGRDDVGVKRGSSWYLDLNGNRAWNGTGGGDAAFSFGNPFDKPVVGDWNGDGKDKIGVYRNTGYFLLDQNGNRFWDGNIIDSYFGFGLSTDVPVSGDWNQDGIDDIGVVRGKQWYLDRNGSRSWNGGVIDLTFSFGNPTDTPIVGRWAPKGFVASSAAAAPLSIQVSAPSESAEDTTPTVPLETQIDVSLLGTVRKSKGTSIE